MLRMVVKNQDIRPKGRQFAQGYLLVIDYRGNWRQCYAYEFWESDSNEDFEGFSMATHRSMKILAQFTSVHY